MKTATFFVSLVIAMIAWAPNVEAFPGYYTTNCAECHGSVATCNGCHAHGVHSGSAKSDLNLSGTTDNTTYAPGETVTVTIDGGYQSGWVRTILYDQNMVELARSTGTGGIPAGGPSFPVILSAPAPVAPGTYTWSVAWYGHEFDEAGAFFGPNWTPDGNNSNHGQEIVSTNSFDVVAEPTPTPNITLTPAALNFGSIVVGSTANQTSDVTNTGTADLNVTEIALCPGTSGEFSWSPPAPFTVTPASGTTLSVVYSPVDEGTDTGCLNISSNDPDSNPAVLNLTGTGVTTPPMDALDLDIQKFTASKSFKLRMNAKDKGPAVKFRFTIINAGTVTGSAPATLTGMQNGEEVYNQTIDVSSPFGKAASYTFPSYVPTTLGDISWSVTVDDADADIDQATAITVVR